MPARKRKVGRPTKYKRSLCEQLIEHSRTGQSFEAFGAKVGVAKDTLYAWMKRYPEFSDARKRGLCILEDFHIRMLQAIATGQARRIVREEPLFDASGRPLVDAATGKQAMRREYEPAKGNAAAAIFLAKHICGWYDERTVRHAGTIDTTTTTVTLTKEERIAEIERLAADRLACGTD